MQRGEEGAREKTLPRAWSEGDACMGDAWAAVQCNEWLLKALLGFGRSASARSRGACTQEAHRCRSVAWHAHAEVARGGGGTLLAVDAARIAACHAMQRKRSQRTRTA